jgi:hypothetical protein
MHNNLDHEILDNAMKSAVFKALRMAALFIFLFI